MSIPFDYDPFRLQVTTYYHQNLVARRGSDLREFLIALDANPDLCTAATLRSLSRIRTELERIPESAAIGNPVQFRLQDMIILSRQLMSRLR